MNLGPLVLMLVCVLAEWEDGWRVSIVDKEKPFLKALSKMGRMYLTKRYQCVIIA